MVNVVVRTFFFGCSERVNGGTWRGISSSTDKKKRSKKKERKPNLTLPKDYVHSQYIHAVSQSRIPLTRASKTSMPSISPLSLSPLLLLLLLPSLVVVVLVLVVVGPAQAPPLASLRKVGSQSATWIIPSKEEPCRLVGMMFGEAYTNAALWTEP